MWGLLPNEVRDSCRKSWLAQSLARSGGFPSVELKTEKSPARNSARDRLPESGTTAPTLTITACLWERWRIESAFYRLPLVMRRASAQRCARVWNW
jgi:hypothetical protein